MLSPDSTRYKPNHVHDSPFALQDWSVLEARGPDAGSFLHAQVTSDVRLLGDGQWHWSAWLSAKGRVIAVFALVRVEAAHFLLLVPDLPSDELAIALQRFVFRSKVVLDPAAWSIAGRWDATFDTTATSRDRVTADTGGWRLDYSAPDCARSLLVRRDHLPTDDAAVHAWLAADLRHGVPRLPAAQREAWTPQMLGLPRLQALSLGKGCYPGQEIVARTHYLGQAKRGPLLLEGAALRAGDAVQAGDQQAGTIACATDDGGLGLAIVSLATAGDAAGGDAAAAGPGLLVNGRPVSAVRFSDGLQRPV